VIAVKRLSKRFGTLEVLKDVSLNVARGEVVVVIGPSGSGKSTLLRCLICLEEPDSGEIYIEGQPFVSRPAGTNASIVRDRQFYALRSRMGMVFQQFTLFPNMTVLRNLMLAPLRVRKLDEGRARGQALELLEKVGIADKAEEMPGRLSGGQKQRACIARALAMQPDIMLFDEVTSALDPELIHEVLTVMKSLVSDGMTMVVVTHEMGFARNMANKAVFMDRGQVIEEGEPKQLFSTPRSERLKDFLDKVLHHD
jgi:polar amino acid transport system ATP-binding protein